MEVGKQESSYLKGPFLRAYGEDSYKFSELQRIVTQIKGFINQRLLYYSSKREEATTLFILLTGERGTEVSKNKGKISSKNNPSDNYYFKVTVKFWHLWVVNSLDSPNCCAKWTKESKTKDFI
jgi:hypothetical protein